jgi:hypothetical protein
VRLERLAGTFLYATALKTGFHFYARFESFLRFFSKPDRLTGSRCASVRTQKIVTAMRTAGQ